MTTNINDLPQKFSFTFHKRPKGEVYNAFVQTLGKYGVRFVNVAWIDVDSGRANCVPYTIDEALYALRCGSWVLQND